MRGRVRVLLGGTCLWCAGLAAGSCGRSGLSTVPLVRVASVAMWNPGTASWVNQGQLRPGEFGVLVVTTVINASAALATNLLVDLSFGDAKTAANFRYHEAGVNRSVLGTGERLSYFFELEVSPSVDPSNPVAVGAWLEFRSQGYNEQSAVVEQPLQLSFRPTRDIWVNSLLDPADPGKTTLSDAIGFASYDTRGGADRIRFDPSVFSKAVPGRIVLNQPLPLLTGTAVIDALPGAVVITPKPSLAQSEGFAMQLGGLVTVSGLEFRDCGLFLTSSSTLAGGGAVHVQSGRALLVNDLFDDPGVTRPPTSTGGGFAVQIDGGSGHEVLRNEFRSVAFEAMSAVAPVAEVRENLFHGGGAYGLVENMNVGGQGTMTVEGNVFADYALTPIYLAGADPSYVTVAHNTFARNNARNGAPGGSLFRANPARKLVVLNNAHLLGTGPALNLSGGATASDVIGYDAAQQAAGYCTGCTSTPAVYLGALGITDTAGGEDFVGLAPLPGSPLIDSGADLVDRNGEAMGRYWGTGPDRGAVEVLK